MMANDRVSWTVVDEVGEGSWVDSEETWAHMEGFSYLLVLSPEERGCAVKCLGASPTLGAIRAYVLETGASLSKGLGTLYMETSDEELHIVLSPYSEVRYYAWMAVFSDEIVEDDDGVLLLCKRVGPTSVYELLKDKFLPLRYEKRVGVPVGVVSEYHSDAMIGERDVEVVPSVEVHNVCKGEARAAVVCSKLGNAVVVVEPVSAVECLHEVPDRSVVVQQVQQLLHEQVAGLLQRKYSVVLDGVESSNDIADIAAVRMGCMELSKSHCCQCGLFPETLNMRTYDLPPYGADGWCYLKLFCPCVRSTVALLMGRYPVGWYVFMMFYLGVLRGFSRIDVLPAIHVQASVAHLEWERTQPWSLDAFYRFTAVVAHTRHVGGVVDNDLNCGTSRRVSFQTPCAQERTDAEKSRENYMRLGVDVALASALWGAGCNTNCVVSPIPDEVQACLSGMQVKSDEVMGEVAGQELYAATKVKQLHSVFENSPATLSGTGRYSDMLVLQDAPVSNVENDFSEHDRSGVDFRTSLRAQGITAIAPYVGALLPRATMPLSVSHAKLAYCDGQHAWYEGGVYVENRTAIIDYWFPGPILLGKPMYNAVLWGLGNHENRVTAKSGVVVYFGVKMTLAETRAVYRAFQVLGKDLLLDQVDMVDAARGILSESVAYVSHVVSLRCVRSGGHNARFMDDEDAIAAYTTGSSDRSGNSIEPVVLHNALAPGRMYDKYRYEMVMPSVGYISFDLELSESAKLYELYPRSAVVSVGHMTLNSGGVVFVENRRKYRVVVVVRAPPGVLVTFKVKSIFDPYEYDGADDDFPENSYIGAPDATAMAMYSLVLSNLPLEG